MFRRFLKPSALILPVLGLLSVSALTQAAVTPASVEVTLAPGESHIVTKRVDVPGVPPKLDFCLLVDNSGSYNDDLPNIKALDDALFDAIRAEAADSQFCLATFVDFPISPWGAAGDYAYALNQDLTASKATWTGAVTAMATLNGNDGPESQLVALQQMATGAGLDVPPLGASGADVPAGQAPSWRAGSSRVVAITTDASFHEAGDAGPFGYPGPTFAATVAALNAQGITVIALKAPSAGGQMDAIAAATGGSVQTTTSSSSDIADAVLAGLEEIARDITAQAVGCDPLVVTFAPAVHNDVVGPTTVDFVETIWVPDGTPGGTYVCQSEFLADGSVIAVQDITIHVPHTCDGKVATIVGTNGNDDIDGTPGDDVIVGLAGDDNIDGKGGNDVICGNDGRDQLEGGDGNDRIFGQGGPDRIWGQDGDDIISGGDDDDVVYGGEGNDRIFGDRGNDRLKGEAGIDYVAGGAGDDTVDGGDDNDHLVGDAGNDRLYGGDGNDRMEGNDGDDTFYAGDGDDSLLGGTGADRLRGEAGDDFCDGGVDADTDVPSDCEVEVNVP